LKTDKRSRPTERAYRLGYTRALLQMRREFHKTARNVIDEMFREKIDEAFREAIARLLAEVDGLKREIDKIESEHRLLKEHASATAERDEGNTTAH